MIGQGAQSGTAPGYPVQTCESPALRCGERGFSFSGLAGAA